MKKLVLFLLVLGSMMPAIIAQDMSDFELGESNEIVLDGTIYEVNDLLNNYVGEIHFIENQTEITADSYGNLDKLADLLTENQLLRIEIGCHLDDKKGDESSRKLSQNRANAIKNYLNQIKNIRFERITPFGFGREKTENNQNSERTEIKIIEFLTPQKAEAGGYYHDYIGGKVHKKGDILEEYSDEITFQVGTTDLTARSLESLGKLAHLMLLNQTVRVEVGCHAKAESKMKSLELSQKRANVVKHYLVESKGVDGSKVMAVGFGDTRQIEGKKLERTEIKLIALHEED